MKPSEWTVNFLSNFRARIRTVAFYRQDWGEFKASREYWEVFNREVRN